MSEIDISKSIFPLFHENRYLVLNHIAKKNNVIQLIKTGHAYNFDSIVIGMHNIKDYLIENNIPFLWMSSLDEAKKYLVEKGITLVGIEILPQAYSITDYKFPSSIAIMPGNEGDGLHPFQIKQCDDFVYIPQYGTGTASLNVFVATTIILHHYHLSMGTFTHA